MKLNLPPRQNLLQQVTQEYKVEDIKLKGTVDDPEVNNVIKKYGLVSNSVEKDYDFIPFKGKNIFYITANGVLKLCREQVQSALITENGIKVDYDGGKARNITVICRVKTIEGKEFDDVGCCFVDGAYSVALKKAVTNARMRALRAAIGIQVPDEVTALEIASSKEEQE